MEHIAAFLLIVRCSPDLAQCRALPTPTASYEALEACAAGRPALAAQHEGAAPRMLAKCCEVAPLRTATDAESVWEAPPAGKLTAGAGPSAGTDFRGGSTHGRKEWEPVA